MSGHVAWADAQAMPFKSAQVRARAKAVLRSYAKYADVAGRSWVTMNVLLVETDLGCIRTVRRGIADLREAAFLEETGDNEVYCGKVYPIYQLPLDRGPKNTRDRLRGIVADVDDADLGVTPVSHQELEPELCGDTGVTARGDTGDLLGVTPVSPKEKGTYLPTVDKKKTQPGAREIAARLSEVEKVCPRSMLRFYDQPIALAAMVALAVEGFDVAVLPAALRRLASHPEFRSRKHPPQLHQWLKGRGFIGWLDDEPQLPFEADGGAEAASPPVLGAAGEAEQRIWLGVMAHLKNALEAKDFGSWVSRTYLADRSGQLFVVAWSGMARDWVSRRCWKLIVDHWAKADAQGRGLVLTSKTEFEAAARGGQFQGVS